MCVCLNSFLVKKKKKMKDMGCVFEFYYMVQRRRDHFLPLQLL